MKKKLISMLLAVCMINALLLTLGTAAFAADTVTGAELIPPLVEASSATAADDDNQISTLALSGKVTVDVGGQNVTLSGSNTDGVILVAFYDESGKLLSCKNYSAVSDTIKAENTQSAAYAKVMWWGSLTAMEPECDSQTVDLRPPTPSPRPDEYSITYYIDNNDSYLKSINIENPNPSVYYGEYGLTLQDLHVDGYNFIGWFTAQTGGTQMTEIAPGTTGNKTLYAHWEIVSFTVQFACDMVPQSSISYTASSGSVLPKPTLDKYTFVGWSDKDGKIWDSIPVGTTGNMTLYANWASNRNKAEAVKKLEDPIICEDTENGLILFTYEIGTIRNVPLFETLKLQCANGIITTVSKTETSEISSTQATTIAQTIANATTNSSSWTLSNSWNKVTEVSQSYLDQTGQTREEAETSTKNTNDSYNLTTNAGGSNSFAQNGGEYHRISNNTSHSDTTSSENSHATELSVNASASSKIKAGFMAGNYEISAGANVADSEKTTATGTDGTENIDETITDTKNVTTDSSTWNTSEGFSNSKTTSSSKTVSNAISHIISQQYSYGESYAEGGSNSESQEFATTNSKSDEYSSTLTYHTSKIQSTTTTFSSTGNTIGDYRMVMAGTVHVFAAVGYDVATKSYFVYTYNVLDDKTEEYLDYSFDGTFNDYETSIIPFEIPYFVNEYVINRIAKSEGLMLDPDTGMIVDYIPTDNEPDSIVIIPSYISVDNGDGTFKSVKVTGISPGLFKDNTDIVAVQLGKFINEIPDSTFEGCSSLKYVISPGVTKIGNNAFRGCSSLNTFTLPDDITSLGDNAFEGAPSIKAAASNADVAMAAATSGANNIVLDISTVPDSEIMYTAFNIGEIESFELQGKDKEYKGISVKSYAETTVINGVKFVDCIDIPMEISSKNVTLNRVTATTAGFALVLSADSTDVKLNQSVTLTSSLGNAVLCKNITLSSLSTSVVGKMILTGDLYTIEPVDGERYLTFNSGEIKYITEDEFEDLKSSSIIWNGTSLEPAYNASTKTYTVTRGEELAWISDVVNGVITTGTNFPTDTTLEGYTVELANDIYLNDTAYWESWSNTNAPQNTWKPIGNSSENCFKGTFDGNGHVVKGIYINGATGIGLLGYITSGTVKNVGVSECYIYGGSNVGGIVGYNNAGIVQYCYNMGAIWGYASSGGIVGYNDSGTVQYCYNTGTVSLYGSFSSNLALSNYGGIVGSNDLGTVQYCYNTGTVSGNINVSGVAGLNREGTVQYCYNTGTISGDTVGGIVGFNSTGTIAYSYNIGLLSGYYIGGVVGDDDSHSSGSNQAIISCCYATQSTLYNGGPPHSDTIITSVSTKTAEQMKTLSNLSGFSTSVWATDSSINDGYPYLISLKDTY